jgi:hypothetical protein
MRGPTDEIALGSTKDQVALGSHLIDFWLNEEEFERGVRFLRTWDRERLAILRSVRT